MQWSNQCDSNSESSQILTIHTRKLTGQNKPNYVEYLSLSCDTVVIEF